VRKEPTKKKKKQPKKKPGAASHTQLPAAAVRQRAPAHRQVPLDVDHGPRLVQGRQAVAPRLGRCTRRVAVHARDRSSPSRRLLAHSGNFRKIKNFNRKKKTSLQFDNLGTNDAGIIAFWSHTNFRLFFFSKKTPKWLFFFFFFFFFFFAQNAEVATA
jgi:hypothetical protein